MSGLLPVQEACVVMVLARVRKCIGLVCVYHQLVLDDEKQERTVVQYSEGPDIQNEGPWQTVFHDRAGCGLPSGAKSSEVLSSPVEDVRL